MPNDSPELRFLKWCSTSPKNLIWPAKDGTLEQTLDLEIQEARALLRQRIGEEVRAETDFIIDELRRVVKERGEQA